MNDRQHGLSLLWRILAGLFFWAATPFALAGQGFAGSIAEIDVFETTGGSFADSRAPGTIKVETMSLNFTECSNALLTYSLLTNGAEGEIAITRVIPGGQALCTELAGGKGH